ncbi:class I SAM-dependent methyltransferase [Sphingomonas sp. BT-65]|uniref:class I SAM-dependent methyltransferase n=1 Tax=Sphingomonas sp. BT-65 TaxID=2989821 RepID=UPI0022362571|nr:class I SAM-dependent methyltransferase [Sphingomonas sp. BT-65]MCW4460544.1 class I SAM-dependent methyltransferase [Sphingomonas sp. BT-65]
MTTDGAQQFLDKFADPAAVANYAENPPRYVPGFADLHRMTGILLAERVPGDAHILVLGAGGGLELKALAAAYPGWCFTGVDPAAAMLDLAARTLGPDTHRAELIDGYIDDAPPGPFDGAVCLLTLHFLPADERSRTAAAIRARLKPGAPFVVAHSSFPQDAERGRWLDRYAAFAIASSADPEQARGARNAVDTSLNMLSPEADEAVLNVAGFHDVTLFYAAFTWRGWVGYA